MGIKINNHGFSNTIHMLEKKLKTKLILIIKSEHSPDTVNHIYFYIFYIALRSASFYIIFNKRRYIDKLSIIIN